MARVLFTSCPAYGHVLPMLPLIRAAGEPATTCGSPRARTCWSVGQPRADVRAVGPTWEAAWSAHEAEWADPGLPEEQKMMDGWWRCSARRRWLGSPIWS